MDKGLLRHFLGMHIERNDRLGNISINQSQYIRSQSRELKRRRLVFLIVSEESINKELNTLINYDI